MSIKPLLSDGGFGISNATSNTSTTVIYANTDITGANVTASGNISASGNVSGLRLISTNSQVNEGGEITLALPSSGSTLSSNVTIDIYQDKIRFFEGGGTARGAYIDLSAAAAGAGSNLLSGGSGGTVAGSNTYVQFNDGGAFGANSQFTYDKVTNTLTAGIISATNNGNGTNFKVGDDVYLGDVNTADTMSIRGQQNAANGYIVFGNNDVTAKLGRSGSGPLTYAGAFSTTGNITGANLVTGGALSVTGNANVGNLGTSNLVIGNGYSTTSSNSIVGWSYSGITKSILAEDTTSHGLYFKSDGNSMYINGTTSDKVYQYNLSTPWNVSTATLYGNVSVLAQDTAMTDLFISSTGANLYLIGDTANAVFQYTMATPWDITTATYASKSFNVGTQEGTPTSLYFSPDLANMYVGGSTNDAVYQYTLATPGDVSTASYASKSVSVASQESSIQALTFNSSGTIMFIVGSGSVAIFQYNLSTPWDISTATYTGGNAYSVYYIEAIPTGLYADIANNKIWVSGQSSDGVFQFNTNNSYITTANAIGINGPLDVSGNASFSQSVQVVGGLRSSGGVSFGSTLTVASTLTGASGITFSTTTSNINIGTSQTTGAVSIGGTAQTGNILIGQSTATQIMNIGVGATSNANTKTINIGTGSTGATSNTNITIGSAAAPANVTFNANTTVYIANTGSALSVVGNANIGNIGTAGIITATGNANVGNLGTTGVFATTLSATGNSNVGNLGTGGLITATGNIQGGNLVTGGVLSVSGTSQSSIAGNLTMNSKNIVSVADPVNAQDAATKNYVDNVAQGLHVHTAVAAGTTTTLASASGGTTTYNNGTLGVGATITTTGTYTTIDGINIATVGTRILVKNEANAAWNGIYTYTSSTVVTRATDADTSAELGGGDFVFVQTGSTLADTGWVMTSDPPITIGTTNIVWSQFSGAGTYTAGTGLTLTGTVFSVNASQTQVTAVGTLTSLSVSGNSNIGNIGTTGVFATTLSATGNANTANLGTGLITATGNITGSNIITGGIVSATGNGTFGNVTATLHVGNLSGTGNSNVGNLGATGVFTTTLSASANANVGNLGTAGLITATGNITGGNIVTTGIVSTGSLSVTGTSNLGAVGNVTITGGSANYVLTTDGSGTLSWQQPSSSGNTWIVSQMPYYINSGETYYCIANTQGLFSIPITIDGNLQIDGILVEV